MRPPSPSGTPPEQTVRSVKVWDGPTRVFHWVLAGLVVGGYFTGGDDVPEVIIHTYLGYMVGLSVLFRVAWGVIGSPTASLRDFVKPWPETRDYARQLFRLSPPRYVGHNPLGGLMIIVMLAVLAVIVVTGMAAAVSEGTVIPFFGGLPHWLAEAGEDLHEAAAELMMVLAGIHVASVLADTALTGDNLTKSMITGRKVIEGADAPAAAVSTWRAVALAGLLVLVWGWMLAETGF